MSMGNKKTNSREHRIEVIRNSLNVHVIRILPTVFSQDCVIRLPAEGVRENRQLPDTGYYMALI